MQLLMRGAQPHSPVLYHSWMFAQMQVTPPPSPPSFAHTRVRSCVSLPVVRVTVVRVCHYRLCVLPPRLHNIRPNPTPHPPHTRPDSDAARAGRGVQLAGRSPAPGRLPCHRRQLLLQLTAVAAPAPAAPLTGRRSPRPAGPGGGHCLDRRSAGRGVRPSSAVGCCYGRRRPAAAAGWHRNAP